MKGTQQIIVVESLANSGDGVGRIDGRVVFVPFSSPGDRLLVEITLNKKSFLKAKIVEILEAAPNRRLPRCPVFGQCGGCDWQHIAYKDQLFWKKTDLIGTLKKIGGFDELKNVEDVIPSPDEFHYRNRIQVQFENQRFFYFGKGSHRRVYIDHCPIASSAINEVLAAPQPGLKNGRWEIAETKQGVELFPVSKEGVSSLGFRQVNSSQNQKLVQKTVDFIAQRKLNRIYDLYCGQGNWARAIHQSQPQAHCTGIDINPINIKKAKAHETDRLKFRLGSAESLFQTLNERADLVILDPPRAGCEASLLEQMSGNNRPRFINYISCHPATLARDLKALSSYGWELMEVCPVDMFPQTSHLETWCMLRSATSATTAQ